MLWTHSLYKINTVVWPQDMIVCTIMKKAKQRNWVFVTNANFLIPVYLQPDGVNFSYYTLTEYLVWTI